MELTLLSSPPVPFRLALSLRPISKTIKLAAVSTRSSSFASMAQNSETESKKVIVVGGGVIGVCTAYFLAIKGAAVTLIEASSIACAASGKAGGFLALDWCDGSPIGKLARTSFNLHRSLAEELDGFTSYGYRNLNTLSLSITEHQNLSPSGSNSTANSSIPSWIDGPARNPKTIGTTKTTAQVHPQLFTRKLISTAVSNYGVEVVIGKFERVEVKNGRVVSVSIEGGRVIETDRVVLALGPWSCKFGILSSIFRVHGVKAHSIVLEPKVPDAITPHALFLTYFTSPGAEAMDPEIYPRPTGEVYICGMSSEEEVPENPDQVVTNPESIMMLKRVAWNVSSYLKEGEAKVTTEQACMLPSTDDGVPIIGEIPGVKGCYVATGHSCWGILNGPATGAAVAELVMDGHASIVDLSAFSPARFLTRSKSQGRAQKRGNTR